MGEPINPRPVLQHQHLRWLLLFVSVVCLFRCGGESPDNRCAEMACPSGTLCVSNAGSCVPVEAKPIALGNAGLWTSAVIQSNGDLLVAAQDQDSGSLVLQTYSGLDLKRTTPVDGSQSGKEYLRLGEYPELVLGTDNQLRIAHYDQTNGALRLSVGLGGAWRHQTIDDGGTASLDVGRWVSLAIDAENGLHFAYRDETTKRLLVQSMASHGCGVRGVDDAANAFVIPPPTGRPVSIENYGLWSSIGIAGDGTLIMSYYDSARGNLVLASCLDDTVNQQILDGEDLEGGVDTGDVGQWSSLAIDPDGSAGIAYFDRSRGVLKYARSVQGVLQLEIVDDGNDPSDGIHERHRVGQHAHLEYNASSQPRIAYMNATKRAVMLARRTVFGEWQKQTIDAVSTSLALGGVGTGLDMVLDNDDTAYLSYGRWRLDGDFVWNITVQVNPAKGARP